ncbi:valine--tRNA ligase, partial [Candidatus Pelagibacter communis]|uniref:valine--tRNA ligase n=1 Tax=Pelagibacter ubique TaxID=198252 RepID=UPI00094C76ED
ALVERKLESENIDKQSIGREAFIKKVWNWKKEYGDIIINQLKKLGCSCDWSRNAFTMDKNLSASVIKVFIDLYNKGLIYKSKKLVNWDTVLKTAISDLEVDQREVNSKLYYINYQIENSSEFLTIATTRPETMLGDTAVAVNPKDERYTNLVGKNVVLPITGRKIKIIQDDYADPEQGSGAVKITPAHDFNDYDVGKRNKLEIINIFTEDGKINENAPSDYVGLDRFEARKKILNDLGDKLIKEENIKNKVPYGDRSNSVIEPYLTEQWFADAKKLSVKAKKIVKNKKTKFFPPNWSKTYFQWMNNIEPWCISRQLWWGHQIPAWYGPDKKIFVASNYKEAKKLAKKKYKKDVELIRDEDVLDTWFSSGLWAFATLGWPKKNEYLKKFYPTSVLVTGFDIIFFWVARMMMFGMEFLNKQPFKEIYVHALVRDEKGQKMSKSKGNVIDPLILIDKYSADALRFTLLSMASPGRDVKLSEDRVKGYRNFLNKLWNANNFLSMNKCDFSKSKKEPKVKLNINKWIISELNTVTKLIEKNINDYRFDEAARNIYQFVWHSYCDWYVELSKTILNSKEKSSISEVRQTLSYVFKQILILLHPFIPFITEELWLKNKLDKPKNYLMFANWSNKKVNKDKQIKEVENIINLISQLRAFKNELNVSPGSFVDMSISTLSKNDQSFIKKNQTVLKKLGRINSFLDTDKDKASANLVIKGDIFKIYFDQSIDLSLIKENLLKRQQKYQSELDGISKRLSNKSFVERAPKNIVDQEKNNYSNLKKDIDKISITIKGL